jgi:hypothetical protein
MYYTNADDEQPLSFASQGTSPSGDRSRDRLRLFTKEFKILSYKKLLIGSTSYGQSSKFASYKTGHYFVKMHQQFTYTPGTGAVAPFNTTQIWPRMLMLYWISQPDDYAEASTLPELTVLQNVYFKP